MPWDKDMVLNERDILTDLVCARLAQDKNRTITRVREELPQLLGLAHKIIGMTLQDEEEFHPGDIVRLKTSGTEMTIRSVRDGTAYLIYDDLDGTLQETSIPVACIEMA